MPLKWQWNAVHLPVSFFFRWIAGGLAVHSYRFLRKHRRSLRNFGSPPNHGAWWFLRISCLLLSGKLEKRNQLTVPVLAEFRLIEAYNNWVIQIRLLLFPLQHLYFTFSATRVALPTQYSKCWDDIFHLHQNENALYFANRVYASPLTLLFLPSCTKHGILARSWTRKRNWYCKTLESQEHKAHLRTKRKVCMRVLSLRLFMRYFMNSQSENVLLMGRQSWARFVWWQSSNCGCLQKGVESANVVVCWRTGTSFSWFAHRIGLHLSPPSLW